MNISNQEARAAAMTAYYAYEHSPVVAKEIMFNFDEIKRPYPFIAPPSYSLRFHDYLAKWLIWGLGSGKSEYRDWDDVNKKIPHITIETTEDKEVTDPNIKGYAELIERVAEIDVDAAAWMLFEAPKMKIPEDFEYNGDLYDCFAWVETPQGEDFWLELSRELYPGR